MEQKSYTFPSKLIAFDDMWEREKKCFQKFPFHLFKLVSIELISSYEALKN